MSFDVFLQRFRGGDKAEADRDAVLAVLMQRKYLGPDKFGFYRISLSEGTEIEFSARELESAGQFHGCAFHLHGISAEVCAFIFSVAKAGDMVILPAMEDFVPILVSPAQASELPDSIAGEYPNLPVCSDAQELGTLLDKGYEGWLKYRNQVAGTQ